MRGSGVKMAITIHHFQQVVLLKNKSYKKAISCSASALPLVKRKPSLSHTALNREVLCGHTHLCQTVSPCQTFEPSPCWRPVGFCLHVWSAVVERGSIGERPPYRVRLRSHSMGLVSPGAEGISIEAAAQTTHKKKKRSEAFLFGSGICVLGGLGRGLWAGRSPSLFLSGNLTSWINHGFVWNYVILNVSQKVERLLRVKTFGLEFFFVSTLTKLLI